MNSKEFDRVLESIRTEEPEIEAVREAGARVRERIWGAQEVRVVNRLESCADFRALRGAFLNGELTDARKMLVEDHLHSCVACRKFFREESTHSARVVSITGRHRQSLVSKIVPIGIAAAILVTAGLTLPPIADRVLAPSGARATVASVDGELYRVTGTGAALLTLGAAIQENDQVRTAKGSRAVLRLRDGSTIEMKERTDISVSEHWSGKTISLARGSVMVEAAKQRRGRLEIATTDALVSVKGTIFSVTRGLKGSRVSVVEGEVKVDRAGATELLHRGDQTATNLSVARTTVAEDVSWSSNSAKYLALLSELHEIGKKLDAIPGPGLRYNSNLAAVLPENTVIFASIPNLSTTIEEATAIFEARVKDSPVLREWWNAQEAQNLRQVVDRVKSASSYLGDEVVLAVPAVDGHLKDPFVVAEQKRPGLKEYLAAQGVNQMVQLNGNIVAAGGSPEALAHLTANGGFQGTSFWKRITQNYAAGTGWLFAVNMEQILPHNVDQSKNNQSKNMDVAGLDNIRYLVVERKQNLGRTENSAALNFSGARKGIASWIAPPGPMGTLDFVSENASFASSFVVMNPSAIVEQLLSMSGVSSHLAEIQQQTGVDVASDVAASLGGEMTFAVDGPLLPTPSWKAAIEVNNPARVEWSIEQAVKTVQQQQPDAGVTLENEQSNGLMYYTLASAKSPIEAHYVFTDGYLLMAPNRALLETAIQNRNAGLTLAHSAKFRAQLPQDGHMNFSALVYYNMGVVAGPMADQLRSTGMLTPDQQKALDTITANRDPVLIYVYAEPDRIMAATRGNLLGFGIDTLIGMTSGAKNIGLPQLIGPALMGKTLNSGVSQRKAIN